MIVNCRIRDGIAVVVESITRLEDEDNEYGEYEAWDRLIDALSVLEFQHGDEPWHEAPFEEVDEFFDNAGLDLENRAQLRRQLIAFYLYGFGGWDCEACGTTYWEWRTPRHNNTQLRNFVFTDEAHVEHEMAFCESCYLTASEMLSAVSSGQLDLK